MSKKTALVLFSGGLDSTTLLAFLLNAGWQCHAVSFNYGQRNVYELEAAKLLAAGYNCPHSLVDCSMPVVGSNTSAMLDHSRSLTESAAANSPVASYVPARNSIFLTYALSVAEQLGISDIFIGANADDNSDYPDCRPEFYTAFQAMARLSGTNTTVNITAPFTGYTKCEIVKLAQSLGVKIEQTISCYGATAEQPICRVCLACTLRESACKEASISDASVA